MEKRSNLESVEENPSTLLEWEAPDFDVMDINEIKSGVGVGADAGDDGLASAS